jgi:hypothetical protein
MIFSGSVSDPDLAKSFAVSAKMVSEQAFMSRDGDKKNLKKHKNPTHKLYNQMKKASERNSLHYSS